MATKLCMKAKLNWAITVEQTKVKINLLLLAHLYLTMCK